MTKDHSERSLILDILLDVNKKGSYSHIATKTLLDEHPYLNSTQKGFIKKVSEGTLEYQLQIDYFIDYFSKVPVKKMKPVIVNILRSAIYQILYLDKVPDSAAVNEAVNLAMRRGFYNLKGFVNGVLRSVVREKNQLPFPNPKEDFVKWLSIYYSMPVVLIENWLKVYGKAQTEAILKAFLRDRPVTIRCNISRYSKEEIMDVLARQQVEIERASWPDYALRITNFHSLEGLRAFEKGMIVPQDISGMLVCHLADVKENQYCIDVCAAPGGKSLHLADRLCSTGVVDSRDVSEYKLSLINDNIKRCQFTNMISKVQDATVLDEDSIEKADVLIGDLPCSGLGIIGRKPDIKYNYSPSAQADVIRLQREILSVIWQYVKPGGVFIYSTCTIDPKENQENVAWFLENFPFKLDNIQGYLPPILQNCPTAPQGYIQILPGVDAADGFFIARMIRKENDEINA